MPILLEKLRRKDIKSFQSILNFLNIDKVSNDPISGAHTIMQLAAMDDLHEFVDVLLKGRCDNQFSIHLFKQSKTWHYKCLVLPNIITAGVDPNFATDESNKRPVLLASEKGHWRVLETFKRHNYEYDGVVTSSSKRALVNFAVWTKNSDETVLHLALKRPNYKLHEVLKSFLD